jgi:hypothetical protein
MILDDLYIAIRDRLTDPTKPDLKIRTIDWFNDQPERMEGGEMIDGLLLPAVLVRYEEPKWEARGRKHYEAQGVFYLDILRDMVDDPLGSDRAAGRITSTRATYDQVKEIGKRLIGMRGVGYGTVGLIGMEPDHGFSKFRVDTVAFRSLLCTDMDPATYVTRPVPALVIDANPPMPVPSGRVVLVRNSDSSYVVNVTAPAEHVLPDVVHIDSNGESIRLPAQVPMECTFASSDPVLVLQTDLSPGIPVALLPPGTIWGLPYSVFLYELAAGGIIVSRAFETAYYGPEMTPNIAVPARSLRNSAGTEYGRIDLDTLFEDTAPAAPDVAVSLNGVPYASQPAGTPINVVNPIPAGDPIIYAFGTELWSGQAVSYRSGDEQSIRAAGWFDHVPSFGSSSQKQYLVNWTTLGIPNVFGNTNRFTDPSGAAFGTTGDRTFIDHLTRLQWYVPNDPTLTAVWNTAIDAALALTFDGHNDWKVPPIGVWYSVALYNSGSVLNYGPFAIASAILPWSSTTSPASTAQALRITNALGAASATNKTSASQFGICVRRWTP